MTTLLVDRPRRTPGAATVRDRAPGVALAAGIACVGVEATRLAPVVSPLLVAIVLGAVLGNAVQLPASLTTGLTWAGRRLLRAGVVLLGLQVSLRQIAALGPGVVVLVMAVVASGVGVGVWCGRRMGLPPSQAALIACGFSICGAAAVAAAEDTVGATDEEVATSVALVVAIGTTMIGVVPAVAALTGLGHRTAGIWAGASIQEVAQVVAAGGVIGGGALAAAVVVKLARVLLLAPVLVFFAHRRRSDAGATTTPPPLLPLFVVGFCVLVAVHTWVSLPVSVLADAHQAEALVLAAAMAALGCGVRLREVRRVGVRPLLLALVVTAWVGALGLGGAVLLG